jgi:hypothetical protein
VTGRIEKELSLLQAAGAKKPRDMRLDALRGLFLIIMAGVHVPTPLSRLFQEPFGYVSAAEGFIFLGACLAGFVYGKTWLQADWTAMSRRAWKRSRQIYIVHLALVLSLVLVAWVAANRVAPLANHFHDFLQAPWRSLLLVPLLLHQPPLFDILPVYVVFLGATPLLLAAARRRGWGMLLAISAIGWLVAQFKLNARIPGDLSSGLPLCWGSFNLLAWQFLWIVGLALGDTVLHRPIIPQKFRLKLAAPATVMVAIGLLSRHGLWPQAWFSDNLFLWMDKWTLGPLRVLNFSAWAVLLLSWNPHPPKWFLSPTALLGRHSLAVFAFHLPLVIAASTVIQMFTLSNASQIAIGLLVIAALFLWAALFERNKRRLQTTATGPAQVKSSSPLTPANA